MSDDKRESALQSELFDTEHDVLVKLEHLINAEWDSYTLMNQITELMKQKDVIDRELYELNGNDKQ